MSRRRRSKGPRLLIFRGDHLTVAPAPVDRVIIGRHRKCHIRIPNPDVNLKHAVIERIGVSEKFRLLDFGETIPTLVNGEATGDIPIDYGDQIEIAEVYIYFDRVRKDAPEEHRVAFDNLQQLEKSAGKKKFRTPEQIQADQEAAGEGGDTEVLEMDDNEDEEESGDDFAQPTRRRGRRRRRTSLKSSARRRRKAKGL